MSENITAIAEQIKATRREKKSGIELEAEKLQAMENAVREALAAKSLIADGSAFESIPFSTALDAIGKAKDAVEKAEKRLERESVNIGVAGKARQGKSQLLQMLTGLHNEQIPTGDGSFCTAARSEITNTAKPRAFVHYLTQENFMTKRVLPAFSRRGSGDGALGLAPAPLSLSSFLESPLPEITSPTPSEAKYYAELVNLHKAFLQNPALRGFLGRKPEEVEMASLRKYVTKDKGDNEFYVVDHVQIEAPFAVDLPLGMKVFDLPGLGEMTVNIRESMLESVTSDADIILLLRKPKVDSEVWEEDDYKIGDMLHSVYQDANVMLNDWILLVLNRDSRPGHDNQKGVDGLKESKDIPKGLTPVVCDCGDPEDVRRMVVENMHALIQRIACIDDVFIARVEDAYKVAKSAVRAVADSFAAATAHTIAETSGFDETTHMEQFWGDLRAPFKVPVDTQLEGMQEKFRDALKTAFGAAYAKMKKIYEEHEDDSAEAFPPEFPVFTRQQLVRFLRGGRGTKENIDRAARNQFAAVVELLRIELKGCCEKLRALYLENVVQSVTKDNTAIQALLRTVSEQEIATPEAVFLALKGRLEEGSKSVETIVAALDNLLRYDVSYETQLLPYLFDEQEIVDKFDPYSLTSELGELEQYLNKEFPGNYTEQANVLFSTMKNYSFNWIAPLSNARSEGPCRKVSEGIMRVAKANYRNFIAMFVWSEETEVEWRNYIHDNVATLWPDEFEKAASKSKVGTQLRDILSHLRKSAA